METKQQDATFLQGCHRGFGLLLPGEDAPRAGRVEQLLPLTGLEDVHEQGGEERMLQQCFMHLEDITLQLLHYYQVRGRMQHFMDGKKFKTFCIPFRERCQHQNKSKDQRLLMNVGADLAAVVFPHHCKLPLSAAAPWNQWRRTIRASDAGRLLMRTIGGV
nr:uncharacterized protein LOC133612756 isoform X3 [Nerophis lumbriciformis]